MKLALCFLCMTDMNAVVQSIEEFNKAVNDVKRLKSEPSQEDMLELYGLFQQVTVGNCNTERPGFSDLNEKMKWDAWESKTGLTKEEAAAEYIAKANELAERIGLQ